MQSAAFVWCWQRGELAKGGRGSGELESRESTSQCLEPELHPTALLGSAGLCSLQREGGSSWSQAGVFWCRCEAAVPLGHQRSEGSARDVTARRGEVAAGERWVE